ncbi:RDD family protein, putative [Wolbachia endosymbiont of Drosophila simulans wNo]|uniref:RDD family protein n=1 Tax=unclassified Wolbachia TaxID=2640676 RepID=UPI0002D24D65|nr:MULTISPECIES: RDD family protein [unclassified Wolbachia]AGJ98687.1 RDD family protein, putative [Wolbachia endosymbiont of Drosophila simulans wNo]QWE33812.1 RDD family protein, putative [Wolbachia endosymbiont of Drosophila simulans]
MNIEINHVGFMKRTVASTLDAVIYSLASFLFKDFILILYIVVEILMITRFGGTPGKLLLKIYIKDANTFTDVTLKQVTIRCFFRNYSWIIFLPIWLLSYYYLEHPQFDYIALCCLLCPVVILILLFVLAIFDKRKQTFYDKIAKTVVIEYKPS